MTVGCEATFSDRAAVGGVDLVDATKPRSTCVTNAEGSVIGELLEVVLCRR